MDFADLNVKIAIAFTLFLIVFFLMYIAFRDEKSRKKQ